MIRNATDGTYDMRRFVGSDAKRARRNIIASIRGVDAVTIPHSECGYHSVVDACYQAWGIGMDMCDAARSTALKEAMRASTSASS
jgi:hypothetical protein